METNFVGKQKQKQKKKKRRTTLKVKRQHNNFAVDDTVEICLSDFANAPDKRGALKKMSKKMTSSTGCFVTNYLAKSLEDVDKTPDYASTSDDDTPWYDREDVENDDESLNMDGHSDTANGIEGAAVWESPVHFGKSYPFDIWCLLANHIKPEQIQTFACICRGANEALNSVSFWIRLYQSFVMDSVILPDRLMPDWIESRAGLKMRVVRAFFIGYNNLRNLFLREALEGTRNTQTLVKLVGLRCCQTWYRSSSTKANTSYTFFFKLKHKVDQMLSQVSISDLDVERDYLTWNCERDFIILQMTVSNFVCLQSVCGETLTDISVNLSRNMRYHCVKMVFHSYRKDGKYRKSDATISVLDPVCELRVLRWWYPSYPHNDE